MDLLTLFTAVKLSTKPSKADITEAVEDWLDDHPEATTTVEDGSITEAKLASALKAKINNISGLTDDIKQALLECFAHVAWTDEHGQDYVDALEAALYPPAELVAISATYTQSGTVYTTDSLDDLKSDLVVTAYYDDQSTATVTTYTLSGTLTEGTSVITVSYSGKTTTFNVTVTAPATLSSITAVYTQSGTVYDTDSLDSLKTDLVVTAVYSDSTTATVASTDYTLSGTLTEGTSTITVSYEGKTTTFSVTVTEWVPVTQTITWSGSGVDKKSSLINASEADAYFTLPFVSGSPNLVSGATADSLGCREYVEIFDDSAGTHRIGYYYTDTKQIESGRTVANSPYVPFNTAEIFVPKGYYGKIVLSRSGTDVFPDNSNFLSYLSANATEVVME